MATFAKCNADLLVAKVPLAQSLFCFLQIKAHTTIQEMQRSETCCAILFAMLKNRALTSTHLNAFCFFLSLPLPLAEHATLHQQTTRSDFDQSTSDYM